MDTEPTLKNIRQAAERIGSFIHHTPVLTSKSINKICGCELYFKCENLQKVGAFKIRGAANAVMKLKEERIRNGVATHSSGNHAAALALAAKWRNARACVVMPENAPPVKIAAVQGYGAEIRFCLPTLQAREAGLTQVVAKTGATFIHPYNDYDIIEGQGTAALELYNEVPTLETVMVPVGGGGLLSGTAIAIKELNPDIKVIAAEPENADDAYRSFQQKKLIPVKNPDTVADGLRTSLGDKTFAIIIKRVDEIITVTESSIIEAMRMVWERMKILIEPSSAVPLAAVLADPAKFYDLKIGIILSGGNVDLNELPF